MVIRDLTLRSAQSFGSFHLIRCQFYTAFSSGKECLPHESFTITDKFKCLLIKWFKVYKLNYMIRILLQGGHYNDEK